MQDIINKDKGTNLFTPNSTGKVRLQDLRNQMDIERNHQHLSGDMFYQSLTSNIRDDH